MKKHVSITYDAMHKEHLLHIDCEQQYSWLRFDNIDDAIKVYLQWTESSRSVWIDTLNNVAMRRCSDCGYRNPDACVYDRPHYMLLNYNSNFKMHEICVMDRLVAPTEKCRQNVIKNKTSAVKVYKAACYALGARNM